MSFFEEYQQRGIHAEEYFVIQKIFARTSKQGNRYWKLIGIDPSGNAGEMTVDHEKFGRILEPYVDLHVETGYSSVRLPVFRSNTSGRWLISEKVPFSRQFALGNAKSVPRHEEDDDDSDDTLNVRLHGQYAWRLRNEARAKGIHAKSLLVEYLDDVWAS